MAEGDRTTTPRMSAPENTGVVTCEAHGEPTRLTCVDCGKPICPKCAIRTEVGLKCEADARPADVPKEALALLEQPSRSRMIAMVVGLVVVVGAVVAVLVATRSDDSTTTEALPPVGSWESAAALPSIRGTATATVLQDGTLMVAGGGVGSLPIAATELFDAATGQWAPSGELNEARRGHSAARLDDGKVLVSGGIAGGELMASAEIYDPASGSWSMVAPMPEVRLGHTLTLLNDGRVLATGGSSVDASGGQNFLASALLYDPGADTWTETGEAMSAARFEHTATLLGDGRVLITGGQGIDDVETGSGPFAPLATTELYDPAIDSFVRSSSMSEPRANHTATRLSTGSVLVAGGAGGPSGDRSLATVELFDANAGRWEPAPAMNGARTGHTATLLEDGRVLVAAGERIGRSRQALNTSEVFQTQERTWRSAGTMPCSRSEQAAALLSDGSVLVVAGDAASPGQAPQAQGCADRYQP